MFSYVCLCYRWCLISLLWTDFWWGAVYGGNTTSVLTGVLPLVFHLLRSFRLHLIISTLTSASELVLEPLESKDRGYEEPACGCLRQWQSSIMNPCGSTYSPSTLLVFHFPVSIALVLAYFHFDRQFCFMTSVILPTEEQDSLGISIGSNGVLCCVVHEWASLLSKLCFFCYLFHSCGSLLSQPVHTWWLR